MPTFLTMIGIMSGIALLDGIAVAILWVWFAMPLFGVPGLTIPQAIGLSLLVRRLIADVPIVKPEDVPETLVNAVAYPVIGLSLGFIVHLFL